MCSAIPPPTTPRRLRRPPAERGAPGGGHAEATPGAPGGARRGARARHPPDPLGQRGEAPLPIGQLLLSSGAIDSNALAGALAVQTGSGRRLGTVLLETGLITQEQLDEAVSKQSGIPLLDLRRVRPTPEALALVPESLARSLDVIPVSLEDGTLTVAVADPQDPRLPDALTAVEVPNVRVLLASPKRVRETINSSYTALPASPI